MTSLEVLKIALPIVVPIVCVLLTAYINIRIKFAGDKAQATRDVKNVFRIALICLCAAVCLFILIREIASPLPLTRLSCFTIVINSLFLLDLYENKKIMMVLNLIEKMVGMLKGCAIREAQGR